MNCQDIERFIAGSDEVNRRRQVITRVITTLVKRLHSKCYDNDKYQWNDEIVSISLPFSAELGELRVKPIFKLLWGSPRTGEKVRVQVEPPNFSWRASKGDGVPAWFVPQFYEILPQIIENADKAVPEAKIRECFDFFIQQAPAEAVK